MGSTQVLVVGAGPTGLTLAIELQRRGIAHRIVERAAQPFEGSRAKGLQPRTLEVLDDLGVIDRFLRFGADYPALRVRRPDGSVADWRMDELHAVTPDVPYPNTWMVPQWRTGDTDGHARRAFDPETLYLVRPDGYIGCATTDPATLTGYLCGVLPG